jgi:L-fuculokinase
MSPHLIAVADVGKTNAKLSVVDAQTGEITWSVDKRHCVQQFSGLGQLDVIETEDWLLSAMAGAPDKAHIGSIVPVAHGAAAVLVASSGEFLAAPDYEDPAFDTVADAYRALRDPFELTYSPFLPLGLNLGRQLYYLSRTLPELSRACASILLYPQYWAWRLSNIMASEITSLGCHTDLWRPREADFSQLARAQGWDRLLPPRRLAQDVLGTVSPSVARLTGLDPACRVLCGIHDSNASYLCRRVSRPSHEAFAVVSSGTWTVLMAHGTRLEDLREARDMLANVDGLGTPVATARFMGGREYEVIAGSSPASRQPTIQSLQRVLATRAMALPSFAGMGGPFVGRQGTLVNAEGLDESERGALATLYCALQTDLLLELLGVFATIVIDGPLALNTLYGSLLATLRPESRVLIGDNRAGPVECARYLCGHSPSSDLREAVPLRELAVADYRDQWRARVAAGPLGTQPPA